MPIEAAATGSVDTVPVSDVEEFGKSLRGPLIRPHDPDYDEARKVWNGMIDRRPGLIARCAGVSDVINCVNFARTHELLLAVRGGGHGVAGNAVCDGGLVIDLSLMKGMRVDPGQQTVDAQTGLTWGEFDHETQAFGLASTGGQISTTGISGLTLGGGIGWLVRKHGLSCDNVLSADVVLADGTFVTADATANSDLYWGLRGGGGNFGVVTSLKYHLHPVGPLVLGGLIAYPIAQARDVLQFYREFASDLPDETGTMVNAIAAPPLPFVPPEVQGQGVITVMVCHAGPLEQGEDVLRRLRAIGRPAFDIIQPLPYCAAQSLYDFSTPRGLQSYWKAEYLSGLPDEAIDAFVAHCVSRLSPLTQVHITAMGGAFGRIPSNQTAFANRQAPFVLNIISIWSDPAESAQQTAWTRSFWDAMHPFSQGGVYVNFLGDEGEERIRAAYGDNYDRLVDVKGRYDPENLFRLNQNIRPRR